MNMFKFDIKKLNALAELADELLLDGNRKEELISLLKAHIETDFIFESDFNRGYFYYILANCSSRLYSYQTENWYSQNLINTINLYHKAVHFLRKDNKDEGLLSFALTNLGNFLSSQGRSFCAQYYWDFAIEIDENPVAIIAKATDIIFRAENLYDEYHIYIHYFYANQMILKAYEKVEYLENEQRISLEKGGELYVFHKWYLKNYKDQYFDYLKEYKQKVNSKTESRYYAWVARNKLFINDINDLCVEEIAFQDVLGLPSMVQKINDALSLKESLVFHSSFDELRNEYAYARYLVFQASEIKEESSHFYNKTYPSTDDTLHAIDNLKTSHMKSAFRILYSLFDKISYFISKYIELPIKDERISFRGIFFDKSKKIHKNLEPSKNFFLHALFYILKEVERDVVPNEIYLNVEKRRLALIRNYMEHRSFRVVDDFGYKLNNDFDLYTKTQYKKMLEKREDLETKGLQLTDEYKQLVDKINEKEKRTKYILEMPISEFEESLMELIRLVRNSLMYLSLAVHYEEREKLIGNDLILSKEVPIK